MFLLQGGLHVPLESLIREGMGTIKMQNFKGKKIDYKLYIHIYKERIKQEEWLIMKIGRVNLDH